MLSLARKVKEEIMIGNDIRIVITSVRGKRVVVGVEAPNGVPIHRREVWDVIHNQGDDEK